MSRMVVRAGLNLIVLVLIGLRTAAASAEVPVKPEHRGPPDLAADPPFTPFDEPASQALTDALHGTTDTRTPCPMAKAAPDFPDVRGNVCREPEASRIREILTGVAPSLDPAKLALWKVDLDADERPELVVAYSLTSAGGGRRGDPYLAIWHVRPRAARYQVTYVGSYLAGQVHAVTRFGPSRAKVLFVRSQSCTSCEPRVFLHAITFPDDGAAVAFFQFTYASDHASFSPAIEYAEPGRDSSAAAAIETRVPAPDQAATPHLIQLFRVAGGASEWWLFRCTGLRCDYEWHADRLPGQYLRAWLKGQRL